LTREGGKVASPKRQPPLTPPPPPPEDILGTRFFQGLNRTQRQGAAGRIKWMKNLIYLTENRARHLPACSTVFQPTAPPRISAQCNNRVNVNDEMENKSTLNGPSMLFAQNLTLYLPVHTV
jgi:hypothetical protein